MKFFGSISIAAVLALVVSCGKSSKSDAPRKLNNSTAAEFHEKNQYAMRQIDKAANLGVPANSNPSKQSSDPSQSSPKASVVNFMASFAGNIKDTAVAKDDMSDCSFDAGLAQASSQMKSSGKNLNPFSAPALSIHRNDDCASAIGEIRTTYDATLKLVKAQNAFMDKLEGRTSFCGMKVYKLDVDPNEAAVGYELTKSMTYPNDSGMVNKDDESKPTKTEDSSSVRADLTFDLKGGAINDRVNFIGGFAIKGAVSQSGTSQGDASFDFSMNQETGVETVAETVETIFNLNGKATINSATQGQGAISVGGQSTGKIFGLKANETPTATEDYQLTANFNVGGKGGSVSLRSNMKAVQNDPTTMTLDGSMTVEGNGPEGQSVNQTSSYTIVMKKKGNTCIVDNFVQK